jgi:signal transduction histidine kinase
MNTRMSSPRAPSARVTPASQTVALIGLMILAVLGATALGLWDEQHEAGAALDDFAREQATMADSIASAVALRLNAIFRDGLFIAESAEGRLPPTPLVFDGYVRAEIRPVGGAPPSDAPGTLALSVTAPNGRVADLVFPIARLVDGATRIEVERDRSARVLLEAPATRPFVGFDGQPVTSRPIQDALDSGQRSAWLSRPDAQALGLRPRRAAAGLATVAVNGFGPTAGRWTVVVVGSAERVRDRERRALWRLALGVLVTGSLVFSFGTLALRRQRKALLLERELSLAALARERDTELATANKAATLGTLAMGIAHEVSTPLGIIAGRAEQLQDRMKGDERASKAVQIVLEQTERIRKTIRAFLDLVRNASPLLADVAPEAVLDGAIGLVRHRFEAANVILKRDVAPELRPVRCDLALLQQAVVNLLLNACDASPPGGIVRASAAADGEHVAFAVVDGGSGIPSDVAEQATKLFFTTKPRGQGSGLGLAIANEIVKLHRGSLRLEPASPRGTRAIIFLPTPPATANGK